MMVALPSMAALAVFGPRLLCPCSAASPHRPCCRCAPLRRRGLPWCWPQPGTASGGRSRGGSHAITRALVAFLDQRGGKLVLDFEVRKMADLPSARAYIIDVTGGVHGMGGYWTARSVMKGVFKRDKGRK